MLRLAVFGALQALVLIYAIWHGRWPERAAAGATSAALIGGWLLPFDANTSYQHVEYGQLSIDLALLGMLLWIVVRADRFWPMWLAALQLLAIGIHGVRAYDEALLPIIYNRLTGWLGYPMLALILIGIWRDRRRRFDL